MDIIEFYTENLEFKVRFKKELRRYSLSKFGRYKITIEFINSIEQTVLQINTTEKSKEFHIKEDKQYERKKTYHCFGYASCSDLRVGVRRLSGKET